jgi:hypothetical protein
LIDGQPEAADVPMGYQLVARISNDCGQDADVNLEMLCQHLVMAPGHRIDLLARVGDGMLLPLIVEAFTNGVQITAYDEADPDWRIRFEGQIVKPASVSMRLVDLEGLAGETWALSREFPKRG